MNGLQILKAVNCIPGANSLFLGCYTNDHIPGSFKSIRNGFLIANTESDPSKFGHWVLLYIKNYVLAFFDSFALDPIEYGGAIYFIYSTFKSRKFKAISKPLQSDHSLVCGAYTIFFSYVMTRNKLSDIFKKLGRNKNKNDRFVARFLGKMAGVKISCTNRVYCFQNLFADECKTYCRCPSNSCVKL